jgi:hypothetical protein
MHNSYKDSKVSSQSIFKKYENDRENKVLLKKMLQIMERPLISKVTAFQPRVLTATIQGRSRPGSSHSLKRP